jgi:predicted ATPase
MNYYKSVAVRNIGILKKHSELKLGAITFIYGPNGSGKSTFIRSIEQFQKVRDLAIEGYPVKQEGTKLFERYGSESESQKITLNYGIEEDRIKEIQRNYFMKEGPDGFGEYLNYSNLSRKEQGLSTASCVEVSFNHLNEKAGIKDSVWSEILGAKKNHYTFNISKGENINYFYNPERLIVFNGQDINLTKLKNGFILPACSPFRISGRISEINHEGLRSVSCEWLTSNQTKNIKVLVEQYIANQIYHLTHERRIRRIEPLRSIIKHSDIVTDQKSFLGLNMERDALQKTNEWFISADKLNLGMQIEDINYQSKSNSVLSVSEENPSLRKLVMRDKSGKHFVFENVGTGITQIAPILSWIFSKEKQLILIEQPEIHLHPAMQAVLMDAIIESIKAGQQVVIETHSETFLLRTLRRLKEGVFKKQSWEKLSFLNQSEQAVNDIEVYYFEKQKDETKVRHLRIDNEGKLLDDWPGGFFEEGIREVLI